jgi:hypothetical protein
MWVRSSRRVVAVALVLAVVIAPFGGVAVADRSADEGSTPTRQLAPGPTLQQDVDTDSVRLVVAVAPNGSATWSVQYWTRLDDDNTTAAFESLQSDIEADRESYVAQFADRMRATVRTAENATGRDMAVVDPSVRADVRAPPEYGVVTYRFRWAGFAAVDGDTVRVGDAIEGLFLDERTRLVVRWPTGYAASEVTPTADERRANAAVWRGAETSFVAGEPRVVLRPGSATGTTAAGTTVAGPNGGGDGTGADPGFPTVPLVGLLVLVVVIAAGAAWRRRDEGETDGDSGATAAGSDDDGDGDGDGDGEPRDPSATADPDLLSNEERVVRFVREQGGRVKQQEIVEAFDWTEARTSQIVRDLRDEGKLAGFRLGRENVLKLPDEDDE